MRHYAAAIVALQEVATDQFYKFFLPELKRDGYEGIFSPKSRAKTMSENDRKHVDGCAIFYRTSKFTLIKVNRRRIRVNDRACFSLLDMSLTINLKREKASSG